MNGRTLWFPGKTKKAITLSYDDGVTQDIRLCEILDKYGVKCTFNINSTWGNIRPGRLTPEACKELYAKGGHEIAYHGCEHLFYHTISLSRVMTDVVCDRIALEKLTGNFVIGGAYPYGSYNHDIKEIHRMAGIKYCRSVRSTNHFEIPTDWLEWNPTCHHNAKDLMPMTERFLTGTPWLAQVFYLWGHSYEFDNDNNWEVIEEFCKRVAGEPVWFATNGEIYRYVSAYRALEFSADESFVYNPTHTDVWIAEVRDAEPILIPAGETVHLPKHPLI